jgi:hypothetical protein
LLANNNLEGYKFNVNETISEDGTYYYRIDFDAAQSVISIGSTGQMVLKPVIKLISESSTGAIAGTIQPALKNVLVNVISNNKIIASSYAPENFSKFFIPGILTGTYDLSFESNDSYLQKHIRNISVSVGQVTDIGMYSLEEDN